jgi:hypothetical protein
VSCPRRRGGGSRRRLGDGVACARAARKEEGSGRYRGEMTRGGVLQLEVALGARDRRRAAVAGAAQRGKRRLPEEDEAGVSGGLIRKFQRIQGPHCNLKFAHGYKGQMEKCST